MKYLTEEARKISLKFSEKLTGKTEETERQVLTLMLLIGQGANVIITSFPEIGLKGVELMNDHQQSVLHTYETPIWSIGNFHGSGG
jgi:hypothetical protein